jgi:hypothetical protein
VELVEEIERKPFADHLISMNKELLLKQGDKSLPTTQLKLNLMDASSVSVSVDVYHVCFLGMDDQPRHLLGIVEQNEDQRQLSGSHDRFVVETQVETLDSSNEECSSNSSSDGDTPSVMPSEPLKVSCWIVPESSDLTIRKATVLFNMLWGTSSIACLWPQICKRHRDKIRVAIRMLQMDNLPGVAIKGIIFEPLAFRQQKIGFSVYVRLWPTSPDELVRIDFLEHEWLQRRPRNEECRIFKYVRISDPDPTAFSTAISATSACIAAIDAPC